MNTKNGIYNITVIYSGNDDHLASEGSSKLCILTTTATTVSSSTGAIGDKVPITGKVTSHITTQFHQHSHVEATQ